MIERDVIIVGGGQAGLMAAWAISGDRVPASLPAPSVVVLDAASEIGGAWRSRWESLHTFSPKAFSTLPGTPSWPENTPDFPSKDDIANHIAAFATTHNLPVISRAKVLSIHPSDNNNNNNNNNATFLPNTTTTSTTSTTSPSSPSSPSATTSSSSSSVLTSSGETTEKRYTVVVQSPDGVTRYGANVVIIATGPFSRVAVPTTAAKALSNRVQQLTSTTYHSPASILSRSSSSGSVDPQSASGALNGSRDAAATPFTLDSPPETSETSSGALGSESSPPASSGSVSSTTGRRSSVTSVSSTATTTSTEATGWIAVVGAGASGLAIAEELAKAGQKVALIGRDVGSLPRSILGVDFYNILSSTGTFTARVTGWYGRWLRSQAKGGDPVIGNSIRAVVRSTGLVHIPAKVTGADGTALLLSKADKTYAPNARLDDVRSVVWCTGPEMYYHEFLHIPNALAPPPPSSSSSPTSPTPPVKRTTNSTSSSSSNSTSSSSRKPSSSKSPNKSSPAPPAPPKSKSTTSGGSFRATPALVESPLPPGVHRRGAPLHECGISPIPGLYWMGLPWQGASASSQLSGLEPDALEVGAAVLKFLSQPPPDSPPGTPSVSAKP